MYKKKGGGMGNETNCKILKEASKWLYFIVTGLAISTGIEVIVLKCNALHSKLLFAALVLTMIRFSFGFMGAIFKGVECKTESQFRSLIVDLHFYLTNAIFYIIVANNVYDVGKYSIWFIVLLCIDVLWIATGHFGAGINLKKDAVKQQFVISDLIFAIILFVVWNVLPNIIVHELGVNVVQSIVIFVCSIILAGWDYIANEDYYMALRDE